VVVHRQLSGGVESVAHPQWSAHGRHRWGLRPCPGQARLVRSHRRQRSLLAFTRGEETEEPVSSKCFAFVQTYDQKPKRRLFEVLQSQGTS